MAPARMHRDQLPVDTALVQRLLAGQFPEWAGLPITPVASGGTVNAIYRLGDELCVRLPIMSGWDDDLDVELRWLPRLAPDLPLAVPEPVATGKPAAGYPCRWAVFRWLPGEPYEPGLADPVEVAEALAEFVTALRRVEPAGAPEAGRAGPDEPLAGRDAITRSAIDEVVATTSVDAGPLTSIWEAALAAAPWDGPPQWGHGDLLPGNLLVHEGRLHAVIDWGNAGVRDPAIDLIPAWAALPDDTSRAALRRALGADDATWARARGWALTQAALVIPYYPETNPSFVATATRTISRLLADAG